MRRLIYFFIFGVIFFLAFKICLGGSGEEGQKLPAVKFRESPQSAIRSIEKNNPRHPAWLDRSLKRLKKHWNQKNTKALGSEFREAKYSPQPDADSAFWLVWKDWLKAGNWNAEETGGVMQAAGAYWYRLQNLPKSAAEKRFAQYYWKLVYRQIYDYNYRLVGNVVDFFKTIRREKKIPEGEFLRLIYTYIQQIPYKVPSNKTGILSPVGVLAENFGDCDTKTLFLLILLHQFRIDAVLLYSYEYKHAMAGINIPAAGAFIKHRGKKYYFLETTALHSQPGYLSPQFKDVKKWTVMDLRGKL